MQAGDRRWRMESGVSAVVKPHPPRGKPRSPRPSLGHASIPYLPSPIPHPPTCYRLHVTLTRRTAITAMSAAAALAQRRYANWKPKVGVLCWYSDSNLAFVKSQGFTSMQLRLDPAKLNDSEIASIKDKIGKAGITVSSLACDGNHVDPDPAARDRQNKYAASCIELAGKLGIPGIGGQSGTLRGRPLAEQVDEIVKVYNEKYFALCEKWKVRILWEPY